MNTRKIRLAVLFSLVALLSGGCVSSGTYQAKEQESLLLKKTLDEKITGLSELQDKNKKLNDENELIAKQFKKLESEMADLKAENEKLAERVKPENLLKTLVNSFNALQAENLKLKEAISVTEKVSQKQLSEPSVKPVPVITKPAATLDATDKVMEKTDAAGEKIDQSVKDSSEKPVEQKVDGDKPAVEKL
ncbi:MAG: hypothetical protein HXX13_18650 [Bacteroidetes bacterium]|nr:hypothetical protein [Bacteroidota bacterium]